MLGKEIAVSEDGKLIENLYVKKERRTLLQDYTAKQLH